MQAFSAPGKALVAGGYLVLYPEYSAYSIALSSRMHATVEPLANQLLVVSSPQFDSKWVHELPSGESLEQPHPNPFVAAIARTCCAYYGPNIKGANITIWSDHGFHSQPPGAHDRFTMHGTHITNVPKTGLGSSAALTVVVVTAIVRAQTGGAAGPLTDSELNLIHNLSQVAHCISQGKVGSGFDVATAVYGSIKYSRFPPESISMDLQNIKQLCDSRWDMRADRVSLPSTIKILMGDVNNGSETPSMVRKILQWHQTDPAAAGIWKSLARANVGLMDLMAQDGSIDRVPEAIEAVRKQLREMTRLADVPVEPPTQTKLLDQCTGIDGVLGGVVPGAGGSDAICLLVQADKLASAKSALGQIPGVNWLPLEQENDGIIIENPATYQGVV